MSMSTRLQSRANHFIQAGNLKDARRILINLLVQNPDDVAIWRSYQATNPSIGEYQVVLRSLARRYPDHPRVAQRIARLQNRKMKVNERETAVSSRKPLFGLALAAVTLILCLVTVFIWFEIESNRIVLKRLQSEHAALLVEQTSLETAHTDLVRDYNALAEKQRQTDLAYATSVTDYNNLLGKYNQLIVDNNQLKQEFENLLANYQDLDARFVAQGNEYSQLQIQYQNLEAQNVTLNNEYNNLWTQYSLLDQQAIEPPYIHIHGREVYLAFNRLNGELIRWHVPFQDLEYAIQQGHYSRNRTNNKLSLENDNGDQFFMTDFRIYVNAEPFRNVIPELYYNSASADAFIYEIWHIATQLTAYAGEIGETPRYPLETLLAGGGDCEDTAILVASMIKAAPVDWDISLVYMDLDNPWTPQIANHVIVYVYTGTQEYFIETTNDAIMQPNRDVRGWYYSVGNNAGSLSRDQ